MFDYIRLNQNIEIGCLIRKKIIAYKINIITVPKPTKNFPKNHNLSTCFEFFLLFSLLNKIRDPFKVKLHRIRSQTKKKRKRDF